MLICSVAACCSIVFYSEKVILPKSNIAQFIIKGPEGVLAQLCHICAFTQSALAGRRFVSGKCYKWPMGDIHLSWVCQGRHSALCPESPRCPASLPLPFPCAPVWAHHMLLARPSRASRWHQALRSLFAMFPSLSLRYGSAVPLGISGWEVSVRIRCLIICTRTDSVSDRTYHFNEALRCRSSNKLDWCV